MKILHKYYDETECSSNCDSLRSVAYNGADFRCNQHREKYEQLKADVKVKLRLLEENRWKIMRKQLLLFHNGLIAYFSGSTKILLSTTENFNFGEMADDCIPSSFLKQWNKCLL
ncbi:Arfaptin-2 [Dirofilaria immitis]